MSLIWKLWHNKEFISGFHFYLLMKLIQQTARHLDEGQYYIIQIEYLAESNRDHVLIFHFFAVNRHFIDIKYTHSSQTQVELSETDQ